MTDAQFVVQLGIALSVLAVVWNLLALVLFGASGRN